VTRAATNTGDTLLVEAAVGVVVVEGPIDVEEVGASVVGIGKSTGDGWGTIGGIVAALVVLVEVVLVEVVLVELASGSGIVVTTGVVVVVVPSVTARVVVVVVVLVVVVPSVTGGVVVLVVLVVLVLVLVLDVVVVSSGTEVGVKPMQVANTDSALDEVSNACWNVTAIAVPVSVSGAIGDNSGFSKSDP
jgi:hypothetical protein